MVMHTVCPKRGMQKKKEEEDQFCTTWCRVGSLKRAVSLHSVDIFKRRATDAAGWGGGDSSVVRAPDS